MTPLTQPQLEAYAWSIVTGAHARDFWFGLFSELLYSSGARYQDAQHFHEWTHLAGAGQIQYTQQKTGIARAFPASRLSPALLGMLDAQDDYFMRFTYSTSHRKLGAITSGKTPSTGGKLIMLHVFRHAYARRWHASGMTPASLKLDMGITHDSTVTQYLYAPITVL